MWNNQKSITFTMGKSPRWLIPLVTGQALPSGHCTVWAALLFITMLIDEAFSYEVCLSELEDRETNGSELPGTKVFPKMQTPSAKPVTVPAYHLSYYSCSFWHLSTWGVSYKAQVDRGRSGLAYIWAFISVFIDSSTNLVKFMVPFLGSNGSLANLAFSNYKPLFWV